VKIGSFEIGKGRTFVIAECGVNHNGKLALAKKLVDKAKECGADAVKFQTFRADKVASGKAPKAEYQKSSSSGKNMLDMLKKLEFSESEFRALSAHAKKRGIIFLSTPFDLDSAKFLSCLGVPAFKIGSGDLTFHPLLAQVARERKPIILSTGMATLAEVRDAIRVLRKNGCRDLIVLHCTSEYPARFQDANLRSIPFMREMLKVPVGYSDHVKGIETDVAAVALGAAVVEKHFTLDKNMPGPDHKSSLGPAEFALMVRQIRIAEKSLGAFAKKPVGRERKMAALVRRSAFASRPMKKGEKLSLANVVFKRPGTGIPASRWKKLFSRKARRAVKADEMITGGMLE
jgi:N-acetylneuraminate synthase